MLINYSEVFQTFTTSHYFLCIVYTTPKYSTLLNNLHIYHITVLSVIVYTTPKYSILLSSLLYTFTTSQYSLCKVCTTSKYSILLNILLYTFTTSQYSLYIVYTTPKYSILLNSLLYTFTTTQCSVQFFKFNLTTRPGQGPTTIIFTVVCMSVDTLDSSMMQGYPKLMRLQRRLYVI